MWNTTGVSLTIVLHVYCLESMAAELEVNAEYLALKNDDPEIKKDPIESNATILPQEKIRMIPVYESVSAGFGAYADNYILEYIPLFISSDEEARNTLCIKVQGNSRSCNNIST